MQPLPLHHDSSPARAAGSSPTQLPTPRYPRYPHLECHDVGVGGQLAADLLRRVAGELTAAGRLWGVGIGNFEVLRLRGLGPFHCSWGSLRKAVNHVALLTAWAAQSQ